MKFKVLDPKNDEDVLGGEVSEDNVYIRTYGVPLKGEKRPVDLAIGETTMVRYSLSGTRGVYRIARTE